MIAILQCLAILAIAIDGVPLILFGVNLNSERILLPFIITALVIRAVLNKPIAWSVPSWFYLGWVFSILVSTALSSDPLQHVNGMIVSIVPFIYYILFLQRGMRPRALRLASQTWLAIMSLLTLIVYFGFRDNALSSDLLDRGRVKLMMVEPNIFGAAIAVFLVLCFGFIERVRLSFFVLASVAVSGLVLTFSKAPYVALFLALAYLFVVSGVWKKRYILPILVLVSLGTMAIFLLFSTRIAELYVQLLDRPDAINNRMYGLAASWERFLARPIFGNGPLDFSFANQDVLVKFGSNDEKNLWIWQVWVAVLHDEGVFGFSFFVLFIIGSWVHCSKQIQRLSREHLGFAAAIICVVVVSQTTTLHLSALFGIVFGLANRSVDRGVSLSANAVGTNGVKMPGRRMEWS